ncbi:MAG: hypothetical protein REI93_07800, partial [Pedobacter sp.]|nr:hypothetical protein [Pedobacter sp.]
LYRFIPLGLLKLLNRLSADYYFSIQSKSESKLLHEIIRDTDDKFLAWAMHQLMTWENDSYPENLIHIHGTADRIFPIASLQPRRFLRTCEVVNEVVKVANDEAEDNGSLDGVIEIPNGGHFLIVNKASLIEGLIFELIENEENGH